MTEHRRDFRKKTFLAAYAKADGSPEPQLCLVRDVSQAGARIMMSGAARVPDTFDLHINGRDHVLRVRTMWRPATEVGVRRLAKLPLSRPAAAEPHRSAG